MNTCCCWHLKKQKSRFIKFTTTTGYFLSATDTFLCFLTLYIYTRFLLDEYNSGVTFYCIFTLSKIYRMLFWTSTASITNNEISVLQYKEYMSTITSSVSSSLFCNILYYQASKPLIVNLWDALWYTVLQNDYKTREYNIIAYICFVLNGFSFNTQFQIKSLV